jgi:uncharacterized protein
MAIISALDKIGRMLLPVLVVVPLLQPAVFANMPVAEIGKNKIQVEVASTPEQIQRGLMYRTSLPEDNGMVFLFRGKSPVRFWMAHCFIHLDMLMIKDGKIVKIFENVPPCKEENEKDCPTYPSSSEPAVEVTEVLEVSGGYAKRHGIKEGDSVKFHLPGEAQRQSEKVNSK